MSKKNLICGILAVIVVLLLIAGGAFLGNKEPSPPANGVALMAPVVQEAPLFYPRFQSLSLNITTELRYHDYYNSLAHGAKASPTSIVISIEVGEATTYHNANSVETKLRNIATNEFIVIELKVTPSNASVSVISIPIILTVPDIIECNGNIHIPFDFVYPKEGIKYPLTQVEREAMSSIVALEAGGGKTVNDVKLAVASVIINRYNNNYGSIMWLIFAPGGFSTAKNVDSATGLTPYRNTETTYRSCKDAVDYVSLHGPTIPSNVLWFKSLSYDKNGNPITYHRFGTPYKKIGSLYFSCK